MRAPTTGIGRNGSPCIGLLEHQQLKKPLIPENRASINDLMNVQTNPLEVNFEKDEDLLGNGHGALVDMQIQNHEGEEVRDRRFFAWEDSKDFVQTHAKIW